MSGKDDDQGTGNNDKPDDGEPSEQQPYRVGRGKPPPDKQFKKGRSGNPKGRPSGTKSQRELVCAILNRKIRIPGTDGKIKRISIREAALTRLAQKSLAGDMRAIDKLLTLAREYLPDETRSDVAALFEEDAAILAEFKRRVRDGDE